jgi:hypothetical protein
MHYVTHAPVIYPNHVYILLGSPATGKSHWAECNNYEEVHDHSCTHLLISGRVEFAYSGASTCNTVSDALWRASMDLAPLHPLRATVLQFLALGLAPVELSSTEVLPVGGQNVSQLAAASAHAQWRHAE